jgi:hypothetical protein
VQIQFKLFPQFCCCPRTTKQFMIIFVTIYWQFRYYISSLHSRLLAASRRKNYGDKLTITRTKLAFELLLERCRTLLPFTTQKTGQTRAAFVWPITHPRLT